MSKPKPSASTRAGGGRSLTVPVSRRFRDISEANRHLLWHRKTNVVIASLAVTALVTQLVVAFNRHITGLGSRTDFIIVAVGATFIFVCYELATDVNAWREVSLRLERERSVSIGGSGIAIHDAAGGANAQYGWAEVNVCMMKHSFAFECSGGESFVLSFADLTSSQRRELDRFVETLL
jgi:uncharacterized membrane protein